MTDPRPRPCPRGGTPSGCRTQPQLPWVMTSTNLLPGVTAGSDYRPAATALLLREHTHSGAGLQPKYGHDARRRAGTAAASRVPLARSPTHLPRPRDVHEIGFCAPCGARRSESRASRCADPLTAVALGGCGPSDQLIRSYELLCTVRCAFDFGVHRPLQSTRVLRTAQADHGLRYPVPPNI